MVLQYYWHGNLWHSWLFPEQFLLQKCSCRWFTWLFQKRSVLFMGHTSQQKQNLTKEALVVKYWPWKACKIEIFWFWLNKLQFIAILFSLELSIWWIITNDKCPCWEKEIFPLGPLVSLRRDGEKCWLWPSIWIWPSLVCVTGHGVSCTPSDSYCAVANCWSVKIRCTTGPVTRSLKEDTK